MRLYWKLFSEFAKIGAFTIGGGYAMLPLIERCVVDKYSWIDRQEFPDIVAVSQSAPGVLAVNMAIFVGYRLSGVKGALIAMLGTIIAPFFAIILLALFFSSFKDNPYVLRIFTGIRPVVVALIAVPVITTMRTVGLSWVTFAIAALSALLIRLLGVSPVWIILGALAVGYAWYQWHKKQRVPPGEGRGK